MARLDASLHLGLSRLGVSDLDISRRGLPLLGLGKLRLNEEPNLSRLLCCCEGVLQGGLLLVLWLQYRRRSLCWRLLLPWRQTPVLMLRACRRDSQKHKALSCKEGGPPARKVSSVLEQPGTCYSSPDTLLGAAGPGIWGEGAEAGAYAAGCALRGMTKTITEMIRAEDIPSSRV